MVYSLTWLPEILLKAGLKVAEQPGWRTRGVGDMGTVRGVMCHHTGNPNPGNMPSLRLVTEGRSDLRGPLAQLGLGRDGTFYVIAAGRAQHAGKGAWNQVETGNSSFIGIEAENGGRLADLWPPEQLDAYRRGVAAILAHIGADEAMCCGHKEYALPKGRKPDPVFDMGLFRQAVGAIMAGGVPAPKLIPAKAGARVTRRRGDRGEDVRELQRAVGAGDDGIFGADTEAQVRHFQREQGLVPDGIVGPKSWRLIDAALAAAARPAPAPKPKPLQAGAG
jgi:hypothetical protein